MGCFSLGAFSVPSQRPCKIDLIRAGFKSVQCIHYVLDISMQKRSWVGMQQREHVCFLAGLQISPLYDLPNNPINFLSRGYSKHTSE